MFCSPWPVTLCVRDLCRPSIGKRFLQPYFSVVHCSHRWFFRQNRGCLTRGAVRPLGGRSGGYVRPLRALMDSLRGAKTERTDLAVVIALCTVPEAATGERIAQALLSARLVACVNVVPTIQSMYWWEGKIQNDKESLLIMKTRPALESAVIEAIRKAHPYEVPEILFLPVENGLPAYLEWVLEMTSKTS
ncbi:hypothetical protein CCYA_CCYA09G2630 [Cyanidiococcus yangmingshanensis]|nr:hypothetical protein CCYA_CCYA09G2630 [Cyanidiococcus yangmingshanensis]